MASVTRGIEQDSRPYRPSWVDRFNAWVAALPVGAAIFYGGLGAALVLVQLLALWLDGGLQATEIIPIIIFNGLATPYLLALIYVTDDQANGAMAAVRSAFTPPEPVFFSLRYRLTTMPFPSSLIAGVIATAGTILTERLSGVPVRYAPLEQLPDFAIAFQIVDKSSAFAFGVLIYHTVRQLRLVTGLTAQHLRISLFHTRPLQTFSRLTASTALGLVMFVYLWMAINPEILRDPLILAYGVVLTALAVLVFAWPLLGIHRLIRAAKDQALHEIDLHLEAAFAAFEQCLEEENDTGLAPLNERIAGLETEHRFIEVIPTWPWRADTGRLVLTAIAIPLILMILQYFIEQILN
jgi:hypothetical protein